MMRIIKLFLSLVFPSFFFFLFELGSGEGKNVKSAHGSGRRDDGRKIYFHIFLVIHLGFVDSYENLMENNK